MAENANSVKITGTYTVVDGERFNLSTAWVKWLTDWANNIANLVEAIAPHEKNWPYVVAEANGKRVNLHLPEATIQTMRQERDAAKSKSEPVPPPAPADAWAISHHVVFAAGDRLWLRAKPEAESDTVVSVARNTNVQFLAARGDWTRVRLETGKSGWLLSNLLVEGAFVVPVAPPDLDDFEFDFDDLDDQEGDLPDWLVTETADADAQLPAIPTIKPGPAHIAVPAPTEEPAAPPSNEAGKSLFRFGAYLLAVVGIVILVLAGAIGSVIFDDREVFINFMVTLPFAAGYLVTVPLFVLGMIVEGFWFALYRSGGEDEELEHVDIPDAVMPKKPLWGNGFDRDSQVISRIVAVVGTGIGFALIAVIEGEVLIGLVSVGFFAFAVLMWRMTRPDPDMPVQLLRKAGYAWFTVEPRGKSQWAVCRTESRRAKEYGKPVRLQKGETVQASRSDWADGDDRVYVFDVNGDKLGHMHPDDLKPLGRAKIDIAGWDRIKGPVPVMLAALFVSFAFFIILMVAGSLYFPNYQVEVAIPVSVFLLIGLIGGTAKFYPTRWNPPKHYKVNDWLPNADTCGWIGLVGLVLLVALSVLDWAGLQSMSFRIIWGVNSIHVLVVLLVIGLGRFTNRYWFSALVAIIIGAAIALIFEPAWWMALGAGIAVIVLWLLIEFIKELKQTVGSWRNFAVMVVMFVFGLAIIALGVQAVLGWQGSYLGMAWHTGNDLYDQFNGDKDDGKVKAEPPVIVPNDDATNGGLQGAQPAEAEQPAQEDQGQEAEAAEPQLPDLNAPPAAAPNFNEPPKAPPTFH